MNWQLLRQDRGNTAVITIVVVFVILVVAGGAWVFMHRQNSALTDQSMQPIQSSMPVQTRAPGSQTAGAAPAPGQTQSSITSPSTSDTQLTNDIQLLDQKMGKMNADVGQSQTVPVEPTQQ
jgi:cytoskeletal protein RodZ